MPMHIKLLGCNGRFTHSTLALFYVRECLQKNIPQATLSLCQQTINDSYYEAFLSLTDNQPDIICFSVYIWNHVRIKRFINDLHKCYPTIQLIIGGPQAQQLAHLPHPNLCIVQGEVEGLDPSFYTDLQNNCLNKEYDPQSLPTFNTPYHPEDFTVHLANRHIYYESSRGCPFQCSYCLSSTDTNLRHLPLDQVIQELDLILEHQPKIIRFIDRTFNAISARTIGLWKHLISLDTSCRFHFEISPDLFSPEMFNTLKQVAVNRFQFEIGLQSTHPATLQGVNRTTQTTTALANIKKLVELNTIHLHVDLILGLPHETYESYKKSFNDVFELGCHYIQMGLLKLLPDTPLSKEHPELIASSHPPYELLQTPYLSQEELKELYWFGECVEKFHNTHFFKPLFAYLHTRRENGFKFFINLLHVCEEHGFFERSATQNLLSEMLTHAGQGRHDLSQYLEVLQLCWLYSGMRKLPDHLPNLEAEELKAALYTKLPQNLPPYFDHKSRNRFFRQAEFAIFSLIAIQTIMPDATSQQTLCFLPPPQPRETIFKQAEVIPFPLKEYDITHQ